MFAKLAITIATAALLAIAAGQSANAQAVVETAPSSVVPAPATGPGMNAPHAPTVAPPAVAQTAPPVFIAPAVQTPSSMPTLQLIRR